MKRNKLILTILTGFLAFNSHAGSPPKTDPGKIELPEIEMVDIAGGTFNMGCVSKTSCKPSELPVHAVTVKPFQIGKYEVTFKLWDACVQAGGCLHKPDDRGWGRGNMPVMNISWNHVTKEFLPWLNSVTGGAYRLPSEAEWEYAARAGTDTPFSVGKCIYPKQANYDHRFVFRHKGCKGKKGKYLAKTLPVDSHKPNGFGLYNMHGNVMEFVHDCWSFNYNDAPVDGSAWKTKECARKITRRGGSFGDSPNNIRSASRDWERVGDIYPDLGFRLAETP